MNAFGLHLEHLGVPGEIVRWVREKDIRSVHQMWTECPRASWLVLYAVERGAPMPAVVGALVDAACRIAECADEYELLARSAIQSAKDWTSAPTSEGAIELVEYYASKLEDMVLAKWGSRGKAVQLNVLAIIGAINRIAAGAARAPENRRARWRLATLASSAMRSIELLELLSQEVQDYSQIVRKHLPPPDEPAEIASATTSG